MNSSSAGKRKYALGCEFKKHKGDWDKEIIQKMGLHRSCPQFALNSFFPLIEYFHSVFILWIKYLFYGLNIYLNIKYLLIFILWIKYFYGFKLKM